MQSRATLRDVAARAGVHASTASRVLSATGHSRLKPETVERVLAAAQELNYQPSSVAQALRTNRTFAVGVAVPDLTNPVFPPVVRGLEDELRAAGYSLILSNTDGDILRERAAAQTMLSRGVDGVVLLTSHLQDPVVDELLAQDVPLVLVGRITETIRTPSVTSDDVEGVGHAVAHLVALGHKRIAYVGGPQNVSTGRDRLEGFVRALRRSGLTAESSLMSFANAFDDASGANACQQLLAWGEHFSAVVAGSDGIALGCLEVLVDSGLTVPGDVSLVGYGGARLAAHFRPRLTTVRVPYHEMGRRGGQILLATIAGREPPLSVDRLNAELVVGESTAELN